MDITQLTTDRLLEVLQWIADRYRYRAQCGRLRGGATQAEDKRVEALALSELRRRGYPRPKGW